MKYVAAASGNRRMPRGMGDAFRIPLLLCRKIKIYRGRVRLQSENATGIPVAFVAGFEEDYDAIRRVLPSGR